MLESFTHNTMQNTVRAQEYPRVYHRGPQHSYTLIFILCDTEVSNIQIYEN